MAGERQLPEQLKKYIWKKGQSGNPAGRPIGKSLKTFAREYLESLPDDEKIDYLATLPEEIVWKMAEGNPENKDSIKLDKDIQFTDEELEVAKQIIAKRLASDTASQESGGD